MNFERKNFQKKEVLKEKSDFLNGREFVKIRFNKPGD